MNVYIMLLESSHLRFRVLKGDIDHYEAHPNQDTHTKGYVSPRVKKKDVHKMRIDHSKIPNQLTQDRTSVTE